MTSKSVRVCAWLGIGTMALSLAGAWARRAATEDDINYADCALYQSCRDDCWYGWKQDDLCLSGLACITFKGNLANPPTTFKRCIPSSNSTDECKQPRENGIFIADCQGKWWWCECRSAVSGDCVLSSMCKCEGDPGGNTTYHVRHQCTD